MIRHLVRLIIVILLAAPVLWSAGETLADTGFRQVPLTRDMVQRFLASFPEIQALGEKHKGDAPKRAGGNANPLDALTAYMAHHAARDDMRRLLERHGFSGFRDWVKVAQSVALAYGFAKSGKSSDELDAQADDAIARIRNNDRFTAAQKAQMIELVKRQQGMVAQFQPLPDNVALVRGMMGEIAAVMDSH